MSVSPSVEISGPDVNGPENTNPNLFIAPERINLILPTTSRVSLNVPQTVKSNLNVPQTSVKSSLTVPQTVKSNIGVNNPGNSLFPLPNSPQVSGGSATGNSRNKVSLGKGFSMMDWIRLSKSGEDLTGVGGYKVRGQIREVTRAELRKHRKRQDCWMALNGLVYNVTRYMDFHPGGWDELMKGAGQDATDMFNEIHRWVNYQGLLEACLVGKLVDTPEVMSPPKFTLPPPKSVIPPIPSKPPQPTFDFFQTDSRITINIYTKRKGMTKDRLIIDNDEKSLRVLTMLPNKEAFIVHLELAENVENTTGVKVGESSGKIELEMKKKGQGHWSGLGKPLGNHLWYGEVKDLPVIYRGWRVIEVMNVTHDTRKFLLEYPPGTVFHVPVGHHVHVKCEVEGIHLTRSYTPVKNLTNRSEESGQIQLLVKIYKDGAVTPSLDKLCQGDFIQVSDHTGDFSLAQIENRSKIVLMAAGTGCTPIFSLLDHILTTSIKKITLLYFNKTWQDVIWKEELDNIQDQRLKVIHVLSEDSDHNPSGRVNKDLLIPHIEGDIWAGVCGPKGFSEEVQRLLKQEFSLGSDKFHIFQG